MTRDEALTEATHLHYKGGLYRVVGEALHTETSEALVIYEHVWPHERSLFARPKSMFYGTLPDGRPRFADVAQLLERAPGTGEVGG